MRVAVGLLLQKAAFRSEQRIVADTGTIGTTNKKEKAIRMFVTYKTRAAIHFSRAMASCFSRLTLLTGTSLEMCQSSEKAMLVYDLYKNQ